MTLEINNKETLLKRIFIYKHLFFIKFKTNSKDKELINLVKMLNIKSRYKRIKYILEESCNYIDEYFNGCNDCKFKNNICILHRTNNKKILNGCCHRCLYQSKNGCTTKNVACKLFHCSFTDNKKLEVKDVPYLKLLNKYQLNVLSSDYFSKLETTVIDIYVGPMFLTCFLLIRIAIYTYKVLIKKELSYENINNR